MDLMSNRGLHLPAGRDSQDHEEQDGAFGSGNDGHGANRFVERPPQPRDRSLQEVTSLSNSAPNRPDQDTSMQCHVDGQAGYSDLQILEGDPLQIDRLKCVHCKYILREAVQTEDGLRLCMCCAESIKRRQNHTCTGCKITVQDNLVPDFAGRKEVFALSVYCSLRSSGCQWTGKFKTFKDHLEGCEYKSLPCKLCKEHVSMKIMEEHLQKDCTQREIQCEHCTRSLKFCGLKTHHDKDCPGIPIPCQTCKKEVKRELLRAHMENDCSHKQCKVCKEKVLREEFEKHMEQGNGKHMEFLADKMTEMEKAVATKGSDEHDGRHAERAQVCQQDFKKLTDFVQTLEEKFDQIKDQLHATVEANTRLQAQMPELDAMKASLDRAQASNRNLQELYEQEKARNVRLSRQVEELENQQQQRPRASSPSFQHQFNIIGASGNFGNNAFNSTAEEASRKVPVSKQEIDAMKASLDRVEASNRKIQEDFAEMKASNSQIQEQYDQEKAKNERLLERIEELERQQQQSRAGSPAFQQTFGTSVNTLNTGRSFVQTTLYSTESPTSSLTSDYCSTDSMYSELKGLMTKVNEQADKVNGNSERITRNCQKITELEKDFRIMKLPPTNTHATGKGPQVVTMEEIAPYKQPYACNPLIEKRVGELEHLVTSLSTQCTDMELQFQASLVSTFNGDFIWRIPDVSRRVRDAKTGKVTSIYSPPFYSSRTGYKMCIRAYMNGDGIGEKTHLSLFFVLMKGEFDALLTWPFQSSITLTLINQDNPGANVREVFRANPKSKSFQRPATEMNVASGCPRFAALDYLTNPSYVKQDTLYIRCSVDTSSLVQL